MTTFNAGLRSSVRGDWATPWPLYRDLDAEFGFALDVCATAANHKHPVYFSPEQDGLSQEWFGPAWMNPPYGKEIGKWAAKAHAESQRGVTVVGLLPARTDTRWFHDYIKDKAEIRFLKGRLRFEGADNSAPFPSMVVVWR